MHIEWSFLVGLAETPLLPFFLSKEGKATTVANFCALVSVPWGTTKGLFTLNPDSNRFSNRIAQCEFNANPMRINCMIRVHTALCGTEFTRARWPHLHTATMAPSSDLYFSQPSYCFSSWADTWNTVCSPEKRAHCRRAYMPRPFWSLRATRNPVQSGSKPPLEVDWD